MADGVGDDELVVRPATSSGGLVEDEERIVPDRRTHPPAWLIVASIGVFAGAVITVAVTKQHGGHGARLASPAASATVTATTPPSASADRTALQLGPAVDLALAEDGTLFVLGPNRLTRIVPGAARETTTVLPAGAAFVAVNIAATRVWVVGDDTNEIDGYDPGSLTRISRTQLRGNVQIQAIATLNEQLFLATTAGIFQLTAPDSVPRLLPGFSSEVQAITADPRRDQMLAVAADHSLLRIRAGRVRVTPPPSGAVRPDSLVLPDSLEVTEPGIWAVGFGIAAGGGPRIARVNPSTFALGPVGPGDPDAPQGTDGWPGATVFWVRHTYSTTVICYDARTGTPTASYPDLAAAGDPNPQAKIVSQSGTAYALSDRDVFRLKTTQACPG